MYALIFGSQLPAAKKFKHWVTNEVLPSIRETGSYTSPQYDFFHPSPEELERRSKITTIEEMIEDLDAHGIDWDWEPRPRIEIDENGVEHVVYHLELGLNYSRLREIHEKFNSLSHSYSQRSVQKTHTQSLKIEVLLTFNSFALFFRDKTSGGLVLPRKRFYFKSLVVITLF